MKKVLVIEDNKDTMRLISYALKRSGYAILGATENCQGKAGGSNEYSDR